MIEENFDFNCDLFKLSLGGDRALCAEIDLEVNFTKFESQWILSNYPLFSLGCRLYNVMKNIFGRHN
jgi:hypothetical protein